MAATTSVIKGDLRRTRPAASVHLLPCEVEHTGKASVGKYFDPLVMEEVEAKRALTLPIEAVRDRVAKATQGAKARAAKGGKRPADAGSSSSSNNNDGSGNGNSDTAAAAAADDDTAEAPALQSTFRGRRLKGSRIDLPDDYVGLVLKQSRTTHTDGQHKAWEPLQRFDSFVYWNLDQLPTKNDPVVQAVEWIKLARAIHTDEDPAPRRSPRKTPVKDYTHGGEGESPRSAKRTKLDIEG